MRVWLQILSERRPGVTWIPVATNEDVSRRAIDQPQSEDGDISDDGQ